MPKTRRPTHAASWYHDDGDVLESQINEWKSAVPPLDGPAPRAIIGPHAGYSYCGHVMAHAYAHIDASQFKRVFLLGPSHHAYTRKCMLSSQEAYETPMGSMRIDQQVYGELRASGHFELMSRDVDEAEHSLELHTPYIVHTMQGTDFTLVPIMVGATSRDTQALYGRLLGPYLDDPSNLFVVSSDFCHWGSRFSYTFYDSKQGQIWESIKWLDELGMRIIESGDPGRFADHLDEYSNTICGRHPIAVFMHALQHSRLRHAIRFTHYDQSSRCTAASHSSVSYAAAVVTLLPGQEGDGADGAA